MEAWELPDHILFIYPSYIGFGVPVLVFFYFSVSMKDYLKVRQRFSWSIVLYIATQLIGSSFFESGMMGLKEAYYCAGIPIPILLAFVAGRYIRWKAVQNTTKSDIDHFIQRR